MSQRDGTTMQLGLPKPGRALTAVMATLFLVWLCFAIAINWADASPQLFELFCANSELILRGEVWRLLTAPLMHSTRGVGHIFFTLLGLYFLTPSLEERWGPKRLMRFFVGSALIAYTFQLLSIWALPGDIGRKLAAPIWFGAFPVVEAVAIAWALSFKGQTVRLMFILPISSKGLVLVVIGFSVLRVIGGSVPPEGLLSPFGGMLAGSLLGGGTPSPLRRLYLQFRLKRLDQESARARAERQKRVQGSRLSVIEGGKHKKEKGSDGNWLN